jgi:hypothetical protein
VFVTVSQCHPSLMFADTSKLHSKGWGKRLRVTNSLAYYEADLITAVKSFIVNAPGKVILKLSILTISSVFTVYECKNAVPSKSNFCLQGGRLKMRLHWRRVRSKNACGSRQEYAILSCQGHLLWHGAIKSLLT